MGGKKKTSCWQPVKEFMGDSTVVVGSHHAYHLFNSPRKILYMMTHYKFASKLIGKDKNVLDVGCGEGLGTWLLAKECGMAKGIDTDKEAIAVGKQNWQSANISLEAEDFFEIKRGLFDAIVSFDVIEHILPENVDQFFIKMTRLIKKHGIVVVGTPNITSDQYASAITKLGHVNLYSGERLETEMRKYFKHVFMFGANDEVVHTGFLPMAHYLIAVGCTRV